MLCCKGSVASFWYKITREEAGCNALNDGTDHYAYTADNNTYSTGWTRLSAHPRHSVDISVSSSHETAHIVNE